MSELKVKVYQMEGPEARAFLSLAEATLARPDLSHFNDDRFTVFPGFCDVHVHFREPGFSYKETIASGSRAAAAGGYTDVCAMPNLNPVPDSLTHLAEEQALISRDAVVNVHPYAAITVGEKGQELVDMEALAPHVIAFSDDGKGVQDPGMMREAMRRAKALGKLIVAHCEDESLLNGGYIHDGAYAKAHGHRPNVSASEWKQVERDLKLAEETGCGYHVCHVSTKESVQLIRDAKKSGVDVTCETGPHYLILTDDDLQEDGRFKMNPPVRGKADRQALIAGVNDGTVDCLITDHAPHSAAEKAKGLAGSAFGIVGLETAFPLLYTELVKKDLIPLATVVNALTANPRRRFGIQADGLAVFDLDETYAIDPDRFRSKGRATPFTGWQVSGRCVATICGGKAVPF